MTVFRVSHPVQWTVVGVNHLLSSVLHWTSEDPLAVRVCFGDTSVGDEVNWIFARDLLADVVGGKCDEAGDGDVHITRLVNHGTGGPSSDHLLLTLAVSQVVRLRAGMSEVRFFTDSTFAYAKQGDEVMDIDSAISRLLDEGWASGV